MEFTPGTKEYLTYVVQRLIARNYVGMAWVRYLEKVYRCEASGAVVSVALLWWGKNLVREEGEDGMKGVMEALVGYVEEKKSVFEEPALVRLFEEVVEWAVECECFYMVMRLWLMLLSDEEPFLLCSAGSGFLGRAC